MPFVFSIQQGRIFHDGQTIGSAYSGAPGYVDNPTSEYLAGKGPIPEGFYSIGEPKDDAETGPYSLPLTPDSGNQMYGRSAFLIHGDGIHAPAESSSHGCIVCLRSVREYIGKSGDHRLQVIADQPQQFPALDNSLTAE